MLQRIASHTPQHRTRTNEAPTNGDPMGCERYWTKVLKHHQSPMTYNLIFMTEVLGQGAAVRRECCRIEAAEDMPGRLLCATHALDQLGHGATRTVLGQSCWLKAP